MIISSKYLAKHLKAAIRQSALEAAYDVQQNVKAKTPVDTGLLRDSIIIDVIDDNHYAVKVDDFSPAKQYVDYVEYGTSAQQGHHMFLRSYYEYDAQKHIKEYLKEKLR